MRQTLDYKKIYSYTIIATFFIWLIATLILGSESSLTLLFFKGGLEAFSDFFHSIGVSAQSNPYLAVDGENYEHAYPPIVYAIYSIFKGFVNQDGIYSFSNLNEIKQIKSLYPVLISFFVIVILSLSSLFAKIIKGTKLTTILLMLAILVSKPFLYTYERANIILISLFFSCIFIFFYNSKNKYIKELSLIALAISASIKLTPALLGLLLIYDKQWKEAIRTVIYGIIAFFVPFIFIEGSFANITKFIENTSAHLVGHNISNCTIYGCFYYLFPNIEIGSYYGIIRVFTVIIGILILATIPLYEHRWQKILGISLVLIFLPGVSQFYCLIYIVPAFICFINDYKSHSRENLLVLGAFIALSVHEPFFFCSALAELVLIGYIVYCSCKSILTRIKL